MNELPLLTCSDLVQSDRVHRSVYTDPRIFEMEMDRVFGSAWLYLAHESQLPGVGSFYATRMGREPVIVMRHSDQSIQVVVNRCAHKGMQLVADGESGQRPALRCGYHGWIYDTDGRVKAIPAEKGYQGSAISRACSDAQLRKIGAVHSYRGFVFGRLSATGPDFFEWLGPMQSSLDNMVDRSPTAAIEVAGGVIRYLHYANWKFFVENTLDALHPMVVHQSVTRPGSLLTSELADHGIEQPADLSMIAPFGGSYGFYDEMGQRAVPFGHGDLGEKTSLHSGYSTGDEYFRAMVARYGDTEAKRILGVSRNNSVLYPSVMFKAPVSLVRVIKPVAVNRTVLETWHFRLVGAPEELFKRTIRYSTIVNSPAGAVGPDDHEAYRRLQSGLEAHQSNWVLLARYPDKSEGDSGATLVGPGTSDLVHRNYYRAWLRYMANP